MKNKKHGSRFGRSSVVIEGFSILDDDTLKRIPYNDLISDLRKLSAVSILVFDERAEELQLKADIVINMRIKEDLEYRYQYRELLIEKCDLQPRVRGWHRYSTNHDTLVRVYPNIWSLLTNRFSKDNAISRMWNSNIISPSLFSFTKDKYEKNSFSFFEQLEKGNNPEQNGRQYNEIEKEWKKSQGNIFDPLFSPVSVKCLDKAVLGFDCEKKKAMLYILIGRTEQYIRGKCEKYFQESRELWTNTFNYWNVDSLYVWPEMFVNAIQQYVKMWISTTQEKELNIVFDDFRYLNMYPFLAREKSLVPAIVNVCKNEVGETGYRKNTLGVNITLTFICSGEDKNVHYSIVNQLSELYPNYKDDNKNNQEK